MAEGEDIEGRLLEVERGLARVEERLVAASADASAARVLASGAHEDVADVRGRLLATTPLLNALRETQVEDGRTLRELVCIVNGHSGILQDHSGMLRDQGRILQEHSGILQDHSVRFDDLETRMVNGFAEVNGGMRNIVGLLTQLIEDDSGG